MIGTSGTSGSSRRRARATAVGIVLATGILGGLAACNLIVSSGSYSVGSVGDSGVTTGDGGNNTLPDDGGNGHDANKTLEDGNVVTTEDSGPGGGGCGSGFAPSSAAFQQMLLTCVLSQSCDPFQFQDTISDCITNDFLHSNGELACLTTITSCAGFTACTGFGYPSTTQCPVAITDGGATYACNGNDIIQCDGNGGALTNCTKLGGTCTTTVAAGTGCLVLDSCSEPEGTDFCSGNLLYDCAGGQGFGENCAAGNGQECLSDAGPGNGPSCYFTGGSCTTPGSTCSNNEVEYCVAWGSVFPFNCSTAGLTCSPSGGGTGTAGCLAPGCASSDVANAVESCNGTAMTVYAGGAPVTFDCAQLADAGFGGCQTYTDDNNITRAYCPAP